MLVLGLAGWLGWSWFKSEFLADLPDDLATLRSYRPPTTVVLQARDGERIDEFFMERRVWVDLDTLPSHLGDAFVSAEDRRFWEHEGVDLLGIARAMWANVEAGNVVQGRSTLTQQLVKNLIVGNEKSYRRKVSEAVLAWRLEQSLSKQEVLELYMNYVYLGSGNYGVEAAAQDYFGIAASALAPEQAALLAGMVPAPSRYSPRVNPELATARRNLVLSLMAEEGYLTVEDAAALQEASLNLRSRSVRGHGVATAYISQVRREIRRVFPGYTPFEAGLTVRTPLDLEVQRVAELAIIDAVNAVVQRQGTAPPQGAAVVLDHRTGDVVALVGSTQMELEGFIRATQARRQPGSSFKPYVYAAAMQAGASQLDMVNDTPLSLPAGGGQMWTPKNYGGSFAGPMTLRAAMARSANIPAIRLALDAGMSEVVRTAQAMGVRTPLRTDPTVALGSSEVTPMDQALGYSTIARNGRTLEPVYISEIEDVHGNLLGAAGSSVFIGGVPVVRLPGGGGEQVLDPGIAYELSDMLREVVRAGTARRAFVPNLDRRGKTGTTNNFIDAWFVGYTPRYTVAVWIGTDGTATLGEGETGGRAALPAWIRIVEALGEVPGETQPMPDRAVLVRHEGRLVPIARGHVPTRVLERPRVSQEPLPAFPK
jgi:penicillin-binding protein 1A